jgi:predicted RNase H-like HicB family nuclease
VPIEVIAVVHPINGGGYWAEVPCFTGCVAQAENLETLKGNIRLAIADWLTDSPMKSEDEARQLAAIQGGGGPVDETFPQPYDYLPPSSWTDEDEVGQARKLGRPNSRPDGPISSSLISQSPTASPSFLLGDRPKTWGLSACLP